jgi:hypothetical protein
MGQQHGITRRRMISGLGAAGVAALGGSTGFAAQAGQVYGAAGGFGQP